MKEYLFTSESVSEGHPDKVADQISDAILDEILKQDSNARVACETFVTTEKVIIGGEIKTSAKVDYENIARKTLKEIGYTDKKYGIGSDSCDIQILIHEQSEDISIGVDKTEEEIGAGDQGIMFGFACNETENYMPFAIDIANNLVKRASLLRKNNSFSNARPDMKSQVTINYASEVPEIDTVLMSIQHDEDIDMNEFKTYVENEIILPTLNNYNVEYKNLKILINPTGRFVVGGPDGDCGLTGRKIIVDTYGGYARHGGGAFSGKDSSKVDRSASYMARYLAKNICASNIAEKCEIQISYAIGIAEPISVYINTFNTAKVDEQIILKTIKDNFSLTPQSIIDKLQLTKPIFRQTAAYGHFGRSDVKLPWEELDSVDIFKKIMK